MLKAVFPIFIKNSLNCEHILGLLDCAFYSVRIANSFHSDCNACFCLKCLWKFFSLTLFSVNFFFLAAPTIFLKACLSFKSMKKPQNLIQICHSGMKLSREKWQRLYMTCEEYLFICLPYIHIGRHIMYILNWGCVGRCSVFQLRCPWIWSQSGICLWVCVLDALWKMETFLSEGQGFSGDLGCTPTVVPWLVGAAGKRELEDILASCMSFLRSVATFPKQNCLLSPTASGCWWQKQPNPNGECTIASAVLVPKYFFQEKLIIYFCKVKVLMKCLQFYLW